MESNFIRTLAICFFFIFAFSACDFTGSGDNNQEKNVAIKLLYPDEQDFNQKYGNYFSSSHPNIQIEILSKGDIEKYSDIEQVIEKEKPDILLLTLEQYEKLAMGGRLVELEPLIKEDQFDIDNILPGIVDVLRERGGGILYGLNPFFYSQALYYNKDLFDKYRITYPNDSMSWEEVFQLARRFPLKESDYHILTENSPSVEYFDVIRMIGDSRGLSLINWENKQATIDTESWKSVFKLVVDAYRDGVLRQQQINENSNGRTLEDIASMNLFVSGKSAMTIGDSSLIYFLQRVKENVHDFHSFNWDLATFPIDSENTGYNSSFVISGIYAINSKTSNLQQAWELVKYINGDTSAKIQSKISQGLQSRTKYIKDAEGHHVEAFYKLEPMRTKLGGDQLPAQLNQTLRTLCNETVETILEQRLSLDQALKKIQGDIQTLLS